jgi:hypothetical protein
MPGDPLVVLPSNLLDGLAGADQRRLANALKQVRGLKALTLASGGSGITAGVKGTSGSISDGTNNTLRIDARLPGEHGNKIRYATKRRSIDKPPGAADGYEFVFDLTIIYPHPDAKATDYTKDFATAAVDATANTVALPKHGLDTGRVMQVSNTGGGLPGGLSAQVPYWVIRVDQDTIKLATSEANAFAGTAIDITTQGTGTHTIKDVTVEKFTGSMIDTHPLYIETVVNGNSDLVTATDLDSATAGETTTGATRPSDTAVTAFTAGLNEAALTGVFRGDNFPLVLNLTDAALITDGVWATQKDKVAFQTTVNANKTLLLLVFPKP